jgi:hypothetical protein
MFYVLARTLGGGPREGILSSFGTSISEKLSESTSLDRHSDDDHNPTPDGAPATSAVS